MDCGLQSPEWGRTPRRGKKCAKKAIVALRHSPAESDHVAIQLDGYESVVRYSARAAKAYIKRRVLNGPKKHKRRRPHDYCSTWLAG
jgi:hypothetical protein